MMESGSELCLDKLYPGKDLKIIDIRQQKDKIIIRMTSFAETFSKFLNTYSRVTERYADFICTLALETIKKALSHELPATTTIPHANKSTNLEQPCKNSNPIRITVRDFLRNVIK